VPLGEYTELAAQGLHDTGSENYGGPIVTGGLVIIGATNFDRQIRAFDRRTGKLLWRADLPFSGNASHDLEDIINVLDGRPGLLEEVENAPAELRAYLRARFTDLLTTPNFLDVLPGMIFPDESLAERTLVVAERIRLLAQQGKD
jgi:hypothetical protein